MRFVLPLLFIGALFTSSCANQQVSNDMLIQKRKYNKGFHLRMSFFDYQNCHEGEAPAKKKPAQAPKNIQPAPQKAEREEPVIPEKPEQIRLYEEIQAKPGTLLFKNQKTTGALAHPPVPHAQRKKKLSEKISHTISPSFLDYYWESDLYGFFFGIFALVCALVALFSVLFFPNPLIISLMLFASWLSAGLAFLIGAFNMFRHAIFDREGEALAAIAFVSPLIVALIWLLIAILGAT